MLMGYGTDIIILIFLLLLSGFFSGSEVALISLSKFKVRHMASQKRFGAVYVKRLKDDPQRMLATILIGNNIVNVGAAALMTSITLSLFENHAISIATGIMTFLILIFGEITPKSIATQNNEFVSQLVAAPIWYLSLVLAPVLNLLDKFLNGFMKLLGIKTKEKAITEEELISVIKTAQEEGTIKDIEKNLISRIFEFSDMNVAEITTPRRDMAMISSKSTITDAMRLMLKTKFSRIPIFEKNRDNIVGIMYVKDVMKYMQDKNHKIQVTKIMNKPYFVPTSKMISSLLRQFQRRKDQMAIVVDEHGAITGLVTMEDVLEEIVGEILDETDKLDPNINSLSKNVWLVKGKTDVDEVNERLNMRLKGEGYDTVSGFILQRFGKIPSEKDEVTHNNFKLTIEKIDQHRISLVRIEKT